MNKTAQIVLITLAAVTVIIGGGLLIRYAIRKRDENEELKDRLSTSEAGRINLLNDHIQKSQQPELIRQPCYQLQSWQVNSELLEICHYQN